MNLTLASLNEYGELVSDSKLPNFTLAWLNLTESDSVDVYHREGARGAGAVRPMVTPTSLFPKRSGGQVSFLR